MNSTLLLALSCLALQDSDPQITYETVAIPVSRALEEINKSSGTKLKVVPQLQNEVVVISIKGVASTEFKSKLAKSLLATWVKQDDGTEQLTPDTLARTTASRAKSAERLKAIEKSLADMREILKPKPKEEPSVPDMDFDFDMGSGGGAGKKLLAKLSFALRAADIAALNKGDRVVYSTEPNQMQRRLAVSNLAQIVSEFVTAHNTEVTMSSNGEAVDPAMAEQIEKVKAMFGDLARQPKRIETPPKKILLVVERGGLFGFMGDNLQLHAVAFDAKGDVLATASDSLTSPFEDLSEVATTTTSASGEVPTTEPEKEQEPKETDPALAKPVELSKLSQELKSVFGGGGAAPSNKQVSEELMEAILHPDVRDPLSFETSENLLALAKAQQDNLIAVLPDTKMDMGYFGRMGKGATLATIKEGLSSDSEVKSEFTEGWITVGPSDPEEARLSRVDRKSLGALLQSARSTIVPSLDSLAAYATLNPPLAETPVVMPHVMLVAPNALSAGMRGTQDWQMLRLYGLMSVTDRASLRQGKSLPFSGFNAKAQAVLRQMVFGADAQLQIGPDKAETPFNMFLAMGTGGGVPRNSYREEPTELLPTGLPASGVLSLNVKPSHFVMPASDNPGMFAMMMGAMGAQEYAMIKYFMEEPKFAQAGSRMPKLDKFRVGQRETLDFRLILAQDVSQKHTLMDNRMAKDATVVGPDGLPQDFMKEVDAQMKLLKEGLSPLMQMGSMFGGQGVPPR